jgi:shikimate kinase
MAVGKSTVGRRLAERLRLPFCDSDDDLAEARGITGGELAERDGVEALHRWEAGHLRGALARPEPVVVAAAASVADDAACLAALQEPFVVWLRAPAAVLARRLEGDDRAARRRRSLGDGDLVTEVAELADRRAPRLAAVADLTVDTVVDGTPTPPDEIVSRIAPRIAPVTSGSDER